MKKVKIEESIVDSLRRKIATGEKMLKFGTETEKSKRRLQSMIEQYKYQLEKLN